VGTLASKHLISIDYYPIIEAIARALMASRLLLCYSLGNWAGGKCLPYPFIKATTCDFTTQEKVSQCLSINLLLL
jgi:hypothetical protein